MVVHEHGDYSRIWRSDGRFVVAAQLERTRRRDQAIANKASGTTSARIEAARLITVR
jgi:hypothetical protein